MLIKSVYKFIVYIPHKMGCNRKTSVKLLQVDTKNMLADKNMVNSN